jgi:ribosomal protein S18 acetylase RimI-like enzyme
VTITVRDASAGDEDIVVELIQELARVTGGTSPVKREHVHRWLADPACGALLGELDGQVVGLLTYQMGSSLYHAGRSSVVEELVVREEAHGRGVGGALLDEAMRRAEASGCAEASIATLPDNAAAARLYRQHGFTEEALLLERHF